MRKATPVNTDRLSELYGQVESLACEIEQLNCRAMNGNVILPGNPPQPCPLLLTESEAIRYLRLDTIEITNPSETLRRYRATGLLRGTQVSKRIFFLRTELDRFLERITEENLR